MNKNRKNKQGFTLMELLIAIAIVAILAAIAIPTYLNYTKRAQFSEIVQAADQLKTAVSACIDINGGFDTSACDSGTNGIPSAGVGVGNVGQVSVNDGVIRVYPEPSGSGNFGLGDYYELAPIPNGVPGQVDWAVRCGGNAAEYASNCP